MADAWLRRVLHAGHVFISEDQPIHQHPNPNPAFLTPVHLELPRSALSFQRNSVIITETFSRKYGKYMAFIARVAGYRAGKMWLSFALHSQMRLKVMAAEHLASFLSY